MAAASSNEPLLLQLMIVGATDLMKKDLFGMVDPYVRVSLRRDKKIYSKNTKIKKKTRSPEWLEKVEFKDINLEKDLVLFEVFDANRLTRDNFLGRVIIKVGQFPVERKKVDIMSNQVSPKVFDLKGRSKKSKVSGKIKIKFLFFNDPSGELAPPVPPRGRHSSSSSVGGRSHQQDLSSLVQGSRGAMSLIPSPSRPLPPTPTSPGNFATTPTTPTSNGLTRQSTITSSEWTMIDGEDQDEPLPPGWEEKIDANGRTFYVDHTNRRTQWDRPRRTGAEMREQVQLERRRQFQQTMRRRIPMADNNDSGNDSPSLNVPTPPLSRRDNQQSNTLSHSPVARPRPVSSPQQRPTSVVDQRPADEDTLPPGWEMRIAQNGRKFYVDHATRKTTWEHPRLLRTNSVSPTPSPSTPSQHQPSLAVSPQQRPATADPNNNATNNATNTSNTTNNDDLGPLPAGWEMRALPDGRNFYIDHDTKSTQWEDPRKTGASIKSKNSAKPIYDRDFKRKLEQFYKNQAAKKPENLPRVFEIPVRRDHVFEDSHRVIMTLKNKDHMKTRLWVKFAGETGLDYGGLSREWFFLLSHEMLNPYYGLFEYAASDNYTLQINPDSGFCNENHLDYFRFIGRVFAMAIYHKRLIDAFFIRPFYKMLLSKPVTLSDMESVDTEFYNSVKYILENDPEPLCLTFTASREFLGQVEEIELKPNGGDIDVTEDNKKEYVKLLIKWRFEERVAKQMEAVKKGFNDLIPLSMMKMFDERELEYLMCGLGDINVEDWRKNSIYHNGYNGQDQVIVWFWKAVDNMDSENKARLLQFVTGTSKVPMNGFAELQGSNGPQRFCIKKLGNPDALPRSHTCFNRIDLPPYRSYHELKEKLKLAIENTEGFEGVD